MKPKFQSINSTNFERYVVIVTEEEAFELFEAEIGETGMWYNPIDDKYGRWTVSTEEVDMSIAPYLYLKERTLVLFEGIEETPWF